MRAPVSALVLALPCLLLCACPSKPAPPPKPTLRFGTHSAPSQGFESINHVKSLFHDDELAFRGVGWGSISPSGQLALFKTFKGELTLYRAETRSLEPIEDRIGLEPKSAAWNEDQAEVTVTEKDGGTRTLSLKPERRPLRFGTEGDTRALFHEGALVAQGISWGSLAPRGAFAIYLHRAEGKPALSLYDAARKANTRLKEWDHLLPKRARWDLDAAQVTLTESEGDEKPVTLPLPKK